MAGAELPCVIANMQRGGPGLGNISAAQSDYFQATKGVMRSHDSGYVQVVVDIQDQRTEWTPTAVKLPADFLYGESFELVSEVARV